MIALPVEKLKYFYGFRTSFVCHTDKTRAPWEKEDSSQHGGGDGGRGISPAVLTEIAVALTQAAGEPPHWPSSAAPLASLRIKLDCSCPV